MARSNRGDWIQYEERELLPWEEGTALLPDPDHPDATWRYVSDVEGLEYYGAVARLNVRVKTSDLFDYNLSAKVDPAKTYTLHIQRIDDDSRDNQSSAAYLNSVRLVNYETFTYPRSVTLSVSSPATEKFSGGFNIQPLIDGALIRVWNGSAWSVEFSKNPAWIAYDIATQPVLDNNLNVIRYDGIPPSRVNMAEFYEWAQFCDQQVLGEDGVTYENRFEFNGTFDTATSLWDALLKLSSLYQGIIYWNGSELRCYVDKKVTAPTQMFNDANILKDSFNEIFAPWEDRATEIELRFMDEELDYDSTQIAVHDPDLTQQRNKISIEAFGTTKRSQAWRIAKLMLAKNKYIHRTISFDVYSDYIDCLLGDVIAFQHSLPDWGTGTRVTSATSNRIYVNGMLPDTCYLEMGFTQPQIDSWKSGGAGATTGTITGEVTLHVRTLDGNYDTYTLEYGGYNSVTKQTVLGLNAGNWNHTPQADSLLGFELSNYATTRWFRLINIEASSEQVATLTAVEYDYRCYDEADGIPVINTPVINPQTLFPFVSNISAQSYLKLTNENAYRRDLKVSWSKPTDWKFYRAARVYVATSKDGVLFEPYTYYGQHDGTMCSINDIIRAPYYRIAICTVNSFGAVSFIGQSPKLDYTANDISDIVNPTMSNGVNLTLDNATGSGIFSAKDAIFHWDHPGGTFEKTAWLRHYKVTVYDAGTANVRYTVNTKDNKFVYTLEMNKSHGVARTFDVEVTPIDTDGAEGTAVKLQVTNPQAPTVTGLNHSVSFSSVELTWNAVNELALDGYEIHMSLTPAFVPNAGSLVATVGANTLSYSPTLADDTYYWRVMAFDVYGRDGMVYTNIDSFTVDSTVTIADQIDFPIELSKVYPVPIIQGATWDATAGTFTWGGASHKIYFDDTAYNITAGSTTNKYIFWVAGNTTYSTTANEAVYSALDPAQGEFQIAINYDDSYELAWLAQANMVIGSAYIGTGAVQNIHIGNLIKSDNYQYTPGVSASGWAINKNGQIFATDIEIYKSDGTKIIDGNTGVEWNGINNTPAGIYNSNISDSDLIGNIWAELPGSGADVTNYSDTRISNSLGNFTGTIQGNLSTLIVNNAKDAMATVTNMSNDDKLSIAEKAVWRTNWPAMEQNYTNLLAKANSYTPAVDVSAFATAKNALLSYLTSPGAVWSAKDSDSDISGTTLVGLVSNYYAAQLDAIAAMYNQEAADQIATLNSTLSDQIDLKIAVWVQSTDPSAGWSGTDADHAGDLWFDTTAGVLTWQEWNGSGWGTANSALTNLHNLADGKTTIWYGENITPNNSTGADGDYYHVKTTATGIISIYKKTSGSWGTAISTYEEGATVGMTAAEALQLSTLQTQADNKISVYVQPASQVPSWTDSNSNHIDDQWYVTDELKWYTFNGTNWVVTDQSISNINALANGKTTYHYVTTAPDASLGVVDDFAIYKINDAIKFYKKTSTTVWTLLTQYSETQGQNLTWDFSNWYLAGHTLETIADLPVGNTALRLVDASYPHANKYIPIDTTKRYRVKFWAKPSTDCTGRLYFSLRQAISAGVFCATNGGRSPYKPGGFSKSAHETAYGVDTWGEYVFDWYGPDWQADVKFVLPEFLDNYGTSVVGHWDVCGITVMDVTDVANDQLSSQNILDGAGWALLPESGATVGMTAAQETAFNSLQSQADNKISVYVQDSNTPPSWTDANANHYGDQWYQPDTLKWRRYTSGGWVDSDATSLPGLQTAIEGKTTYHYVTGTPSGSLGNVGDYALYRSGTVVRFYEKTGATTWTQRTTYEEGSTKGAPSGTYVGSTLAQNVEANANNSASAITDIASDNKFTPNEKVSVKREWEAIASELSVIEAQATTYGITTEKNTYTAAFQALANYLNGGAAWVSGDPLWLNSTYLTQTTNITGSTFRATFKAYYDARVALIRKVTDTADTNIGTAATTANWTGVASRPTSLSTLNVTDGNTLSSASTNATNAVNALTDIASDNKFTPNEKVSVKREWEAIVSEKSVIEAQANTYSITTEKTTYTNAFQVLANYLNGGSTWSAGDPLWLNSTYLSQTTNIVGTTFRTRFNTYYNARVALIKKITDVANSNIGAAALTATWTSVSSRPTSLSTLNSTDGNKLAGIDANATNGAEFGVNISGQITPANADTYIDNLAIGTAHIANLAVETAKIQDNAVTVPVGYGTTALMNTLNTWTQVATLNINSGGQPVWLSFAAFCYLTLTATGIEIGSIQLRIKRGSTILFSRLALNTRPLTSGQSETLYGPGILQYYDESTATGTRTYSVDALITADGGYVDDRTLFAIGVKK